ncbi:MAG: hypothetical protein F6J95_030990 [Leptolyngbya sp. SIO1E4]|nr:hypothetical protein [Leptolyngbya sp. SIO1E4]
MTTTTALAHTRTAHQRRLRAATQRLVIELGYLEHCLTEGLQDANLRAAAAGLDTAIDCLNSRLAES